MLFFGLTVTTFGYLYKSFVDFERDTVAEINDAAAELRKLTGQLIEEQGYAATFHADDATS